MITPKLDELIHSGDAKTQTFVVGLSGSTVLPVPSGKYIVIHNICYFPFFNAPDGKTTPVSTINSLCNKQVEFRSEKTQNHFVFRDSGNAVQVPVILDTYLVHFDDVAITFLQVPSIDPAQVVFSAVPITTVVRAAPTGYGGLTATERVNLDGAVQMYQPSGVKNSGLNPSPSYREQFKVNPSAGTILFNPATASPGELDRALPLMNIQYVLINKRATDKVQSS